MGPRAGAVWRVACFNQLWARKAAQAKPAHVRGGAEALGGGRGRGGAGWAGERRRWGIVVRQVRRVVACIWLKCLHVSDEPRLRFRTCMPSGYMLLISLYHISSCFACVVVVQVIFLKPTFFEASPSLIWTLVDSAFLQRIKNTTTGWYVWVQESRSVNCRAILRALFNKVREDPPVNCRGKFSNVKL